VRLRRSVDERGEWWEPVGAPTPLPTVVLVHGGFWRSGYDRHLEDALAADLAGRGYLVWNVDYRPASEPWPATLVDAAAAYDAVGTGARAALVDRERIAVVGHSAGGHLALWLASRHRVTAGAPGACGPDWLPPALSVGQAPVAALERAAEQQLGVGAALALVGGAPDDVPDRYAVADPTSLAPATCTVVLIHGRDDDVVPIEQSEHYATAATSAGGAVRLHTYAGGHYEHLDPSSAACDLLRAALHDGLG
jgi:acetyl esterase/lipase